MIFSRKPSKHTQLYSMTAGGISLKKYGNELHIFEKSPESAQSAHAYCINQVSAVAYSGHQLALIEIEEDILLTKIRECRLRQTIS
jgi:hypothetical protein